MVVGTTMDKIGLKRIGLIGSAVMVLSGVFLCSGTASGSWALIVVALLLGGFAYGGSSSSYAAGIKNAFGTKHYTQNFALSQLAMGVAALFESASGSVYDLFGSYASVGVMMLIFAVIALVMSFLGLKFFKPHYTLPLEKQLTKA